MADSADASAAEKSTNEPMEVDDDDKEPEGIMIDDIYVPPPPKPALTFDSKGPRLIIKKIEIENFKSYADKRVLGPFHKSFTSIVGPNGSGKSNVIDSMLFVFGYRAQKIRSKKLSVLIHSSDKYPNLRSCNVSVFFQEIIDETDEFVEGTDFVVSRTAFKDNSSYYEVNGKRCQFKDVAKLLRHKGIDLDHNRFLILQGEVEQISLMKPKALTENDTGMLEFLEDIIGSSRFKEPIEKLRLRVEDLNEQRSEKLNRVKIVEKEKDELEGPKNEALEFLRLENEIVEKKNIGYQQYIYGCEKKIAETEQKKKDFEDSAKDVMTKLESISNKKKEHEKAVNDEAENLEKIRVGLDEAQEKFKSHELEDGKLREDMKNVNVKRKKLMAQVATEKEKLEKLELLPETNRKKIEECEGLKEKLMNQVEEQQTAYDEAMKTLREETQEFQDEKESEETKLIDLRKTLNEKESVHTVAKSELNLEESKEGKERSKLEGLVQSLQTCEQKVAENERRTKEVEKELKDTKKNIDEVQNEMAEVGTEYDKKNVTFRKMQVECAEAKQTHQAASSRGRVLDSLMRSGINGIHGRLGDLGAIDKKYDVAVSTAGGGSLDQILVANVDVAAKCIKFLKENDIGRGNFLALDKTKRWERQTEEEFRAPENVPRLFDLIAVNNQAFRTAFYHVFRNTLVAQDMEQGQRIAYGATRYRVATLSGEMIEVSGVMSGGGKDKIRGKMGTQVIDNSKDNSKAIAELEDRLRVDEDALRGLMQRKTDLENGLANLQRKSVQMEQTLKKLQMEAPKLKEEQKLLKQQVKSQEDLIKKITPDEAKLKSLRKRVEAAEAEYDKACEAAKTVEDKIQKLDKKIKDIMGGKVKSHQKKLDETKTQLDKVKKEITRLGVGIKSAERDLTKAQDKVAGLDQEVSEAEEKMRWMQTQRKELEEQGHQVIDKLKELKQEYKKVTHTLEEKKAELEKINEKEAKYRSSRIEIDQELEGYTQEIKEHSKNLSHWKREIRKLSLREVPGERDASSELPVVEKEELDALDMKQWQYELNVLEERMTSAKPNLKAIDEFKRKETIYLDRVAELDLISKSRDEKRKNHDDLRKMRLNEFMEGFAIITAKLKEMYQMITLGGDAELELVDSLDPFTEGIVFSVRPPKKSWKNISNLSGGEKTLSSLALVFALHYYKPTPLYVMDEIDAALDFKNVSIVANYIKERTKNAQFIIISLRSNMFELADRLVGIYKTYNCTKNIAINPAELAATAAPPSQKSKSEDKSASIASSQSLVTQKT